jgi:hypothetical protein
MIRWRNPNEERTAMSERDGYEPGVPCWVVLADPQGAAFSVTRILAP